MKSKLLKIKHNDNQLTVKADYELYDSEYSIPHTCRVTNLLVVESSSEKLPSVSDLHSLKNEISEIIMMENKEGEKKND